MGWLTKTTIYKNTIWNGSKLLFKRLANSSTANKIANKKRSRYGSAIFLSISVLSLTNIWKFLQYLDKRRNLTLFSKIYFRKFHIHFFYLTDSTLNLPKPMSYRKQLQIWLKKIKILLIQSINCEYYNLIYIIMS